MSKVTWVCITLLGIAQAITVEDFYPFNPQQDARIPKGDSTSSPQISLAIPAKFYNNEYDYLWINTDGYISFESDFSDVEELNFPFREALLAPYMTNLDTTNRGDIFYQENNDIEVLIRATTDIKSAFPVAAADFEAESVFIVTWNGVEGRSQEDEIATFTFQSVLVSNGRDTYAIFLYPKGKMGVLPPGIKHKTTMFRARAGFNQGNEEYLEMYPVDNLAELRDTDRKGEWIFQIGGEGVRRSRDIVLPERVRLHKRQAALIPVQDINLESSFEEVEEDERRAVSQRRDYCSRDPEACPTTNSVCVNHEAGYCCSCQPQYLGNGRVCIEEDVPVSINGNVRGVVDVSSAGDERERHSLKNVDFYSYVIANQARAHSAISGVDPTLGRALQPIAAACEVVGWLFALPESPAVNGFQYTGGNFQRRVSIKYTKGPYKFDMSQTFEGTKTVENTTVLVARTTFVGILPAIAAEAQVTMDEYEEEFTSEDAGHISSNSTRTYTVDGKKYTYVISQYIIFSKCRESYTSVPDKLLLKVSRIFAQYHDSDNNVRHAMNTEVVAPGISLIPSHPCRTSNHGCDRNARCEPLDGQEYDCICEDGFAGDGRTCENLDECVRNPCPAGTTCIDNIGSYACKLQCDSGYVLDDESGRCVDINECDDDETEYCDRNAVCSNTQGSYSCRCKPGFIGDGFTCDAIVCPGNQEFSTCAGCVSTCDEKDQLKACTLQCRMECTCPGGMFLNGDMCVAREECPSDIGGGGDAIRCYVGMRMTPSVGLGTNTMALTECDPGFSCLEVKARAVQKVSSVTITMEMIMGQCVPSFTCSAVTCARVRDIIPEGVPAQFEECSKRCCDEDSCNKPEEIPATTPPAELSECLREHAEADLFLRENPRIRDGPDFPECMQDGSYAPKQCNDWTRACWCVETQYGEPIEGTMTSPDNSASLDCSGDPSQLSKCQTQQLEALRFHRNNPGIQDGSAGPVCQPDGSFRPRQCNGFTNVCWCVEPDSGNVIPGAMSGVGEGHMLNCKDVVPQGSKCEIERAKVIQFHQTHPVQDGSSGPVCESDGSFRPRQCNDFTNVCWCVEPVSGEVNEGSMTRPGQGFLLDCSEQAGRDVPQLTPCQEDRKSAGNSLVSAGPIFSPICTSAGAYEPKQFHPDGYWLCVDYNGVEVSRHRSEPTCKTQCKLAAYYAETDNLHLGTVKFVPKCNDDGVYSSVQCDLSTCYCANTNGEEIPGTRTLTDNPATVTEETLECRRFDPSRRQPATSLAAQIVFAQASGINAVELPITSDSTSERLYARAGQTNVAVAFDCSNQYLYWSDVSGRSIYMAPLSSPNTRTNIASSGLRSPEGLAVDFISGNIYWTDSGMKRIEVANMDGSNRMALILSDIRNPRGIAVDPFGGKLYWTDWNRAEPRIMSSNLDGSEVAVLLREGLSLPNDITIDQYSHSRICFIDDGTRKIECMNMDGSHRQIVYHLPAHSPDTPRKAFGLAVDGRMVYYTDRDRELVYAVDTGINEVVSVSGPLGSHGKIFGIALTHAQCSLGYNACSRNNGGCSHLCLPFPRGRSCKCPVGAEDCIEQ